MRHHRNLTWILTLVLGLLMAVPALAGPPEQRPGAAGVDRPGATPPSGQDVAACRPGQEPGAETAEATPETTPEATPEVSPESPEATPGAHPGRGPGMRDCLFGEGGPLHDLVGNVHAQAVYAVVGAGIAQGYPDSTFRPDQPVNRAQMSTFIARALGLAADAGAVPADAAGSVHADAIGAVVSAEIAQGYPDGTFRPDEPVSRAQMSAFIARALELAADAGTVPADAAGSVHADPIGAVIEAGIAQGYADGTFRPEASVTRGQMASFLARGLGLL